MIQSAIRHDILQLGGVSAAHRFTGHRPQRVQLHSVRRRSCLVQRLSRLVQQRAGELGCLHCVTHVHITHTAVHPSDRPGKCPHRADGPGHRAKLLSLVRQQRHLQSRRSVSLANYAHLTGTACLFLGQSQCLPQIAIGSDGSQCAITGGNITCTLVAE